ncbi:MAG: hypothetical protein ACQEXC_03610 [Pseudomonadota bacterium]|jgi:hypothetical protein
MIKRILLLPLHLDDFMARFRRRHPLFTGDVFMNRPRVEAGKNEEYQTI